MVLIIIAVTALVSIICFSRPALMQRLALIPYLVFKRGQWERVITHGFVHGDWMHLIINMLVFWSFGEYVLQMFTIAEATGGINAMLAFGLLYFGGLVAASVYDLIRRRNDPRFVSVGASGAVSAVIFTSIFFNPLGKIYFFGIVPIPGIIFGVLYIIYESWSARRTADHINHHAHIFGALYGFIFPMLIGGVSQFSIFLNGFGIR